MWRRVTIMSAALLGGLGCAALLAMADVTPHAAGYQAQVEEALARRSIQHLGVTVVDGCAPTVQFCRHYHGDVTVQLWRPVRGTVDCRWRWTGCALTVAELGIHAEPLPDLGPPIRREDVAQILGDMAGWLRRVWR